MSGSTALPAQPSNNLTKAGRIPNSKKCFSREAKGEKRRTTSTNSSLRWRGFCLKSWHPLQSLGRHSEWKTTSLSHHFIIRSVRSKIYIYLLEFLLLFMCSTEYILVLWSKPLIKYDFLGSVSKICWKPSERAWRSRLSIHFTAKLAIFVAACGGVAALSYIPQCYNAGVEVYEQLLGELPEILLKQSKPTFDKGVEFSKRIGGLLAGWFLVLFVIENVFKAILWVVFSIVRLVFAFIHPRLKEEEVKSEEPTSDSQTTWKIT